MEVETTGQVAKIKKLPRRQAPWPPSLGLTDRQETEPYLRLSVSPSRHIIEIINSLRMCRNYEHSRRFKSEPSLN